MDEEFLKILVCPQCKEKINLENMFLTCRKCKLAFPVYEKSIPNMLLEDAWPLHKAKKSKFKHNLKLDV